MSVSNGSGNRASSLRVYTTTNGVTFVELTNASVLNRSNGVVASGSITNIFLPAAFSNCATARIRFYEYNGTGGSTGNRAKIAIDNVSVPRVVLPTAVTLPVTGASNAVAMLNGTVNPGGAATTAWFEWGLSPFSYTDITAPVAVGSGVVPVTVTNLLSRLTPGLIYHGRLVVSNAVGAARGLDVAFGSPLLTLNGAATVTNECHTDVADPGASATGAPLAIAGGGTHSLLLRMDGTVVVWGFNGFGQTDVPSGLGNVVASAAGSAHSLALKIDGTVVAWGNNGFGQTSVPAGLSNVAAVAGGTYHSLALKNDGTVAAWGRGREGQTFLPVGLSNVVAVAGGAYHSLALKSDGTVAAWGYNAYGQTTIPAGLSNVVAVAAGGSNSLALRSDGTVAVWGSNTNIPAGLSNVVAIAVGGYHSLALKSDGTVIAWGNNAFGQTTIPADLSTLALIVGDAFNTNSSPGTYTVTYMNSNSLGGISTATRTIVVQDTLPPVITLLDGNSLTLLTNAPFVDPGATSLDACDDSHVMTTNNTVNVAVPGTYTVSYIATDSLGHSATNTRIVNVVAAPPQVISPVRLGNGTLQFGFTSQPGVGFTVWASTNVALPLGQWSNLGAPAEAPAGTFRFTDPQATNKAQRFYRVSSP